jgi:UDP-N-acetylmuramate--alanine ligase
MIIDKMSSTNKHLISKQDLVKTIVEQKPELFLILGAGDIDTLVEPIKAGLLAGG